jgi:hypothetical protein
MAPTYTQDVKMARDTCETTAEEGPAPSFAITYICVCVCVYRTEENQITAEEEGNRNYLYRVR